MKRKFEPQRGDSGRSIVSRLVLQRNCARFHFNDPDYVSFGPITSIGYFERYVDHQPVLEHREEFGAGVEECVRSRGRRIGNSWMKMNFYVRSITAVELLDNHL